MVAWELVLVFFYFWLMHLVPGPSFPCFRSMPSNSRVPSAVTGTKPFSCFTSFTLLLHYLQEWTEVIGTSLVCTRRR